MLCLILKKTLAGKRYLIFQHSDSNVHQSLGQYTHFIIAIAAFTTMFSTTITTLDASPRAMSYSSKLLMGKQIKYSYALWMSILISGTLVILLFFISEMKTLIEIATIIIICNGAILCHNKLQTYHLHHIHLRFTDQEKQCVF